MRESLMDEKGKKCARLGHERRLLGRKCPKNARLDHERTENGTRKVPILPLFIRLYL